MKFKFCYLLSFRLTEKNYGIMFAYLAKWAYFILLSTQHVLSDFDCLCNYAAETSVYGIPDTVGQPIGYLDEFDCKPTANANQAVQNFYAVQFEKQLGYVKTDASQIKMQTCPGNAPDADLIPAGVTIPEHLHNNTTTPSSAPSSHEATSPAVALTTPASLLSSSIPFTIPPGNWSEDSDLEVPTSWPTGTYGLMETAHGCPGANTHWSTGWRKQDTEDERSQNSFSSGINNFLKGEFNRYGITTYFCIKTSQYGSQNDQPWPRGTFCLLKYGSCPNGFAVGSIFWDDEDSSNHNGRGGTLPDGNYDRNTRIFYCCRNDDSPNTPIILPTDRPFVLIRFGNTCQAVYEMHVQDLYIRWDDEDDSNKDSVGGMHPSDVGGSRNHQLHFCYYRSLNSPSLIG